MLPRCEGSSEVIAKSACSYRREDLRKRLGAKLETERFIWNWSILIDSWSYGCSTTTRFRKPSDQGFALNLFTFWRHKRWPVPKIVDARGMTRGGNGWTV